VSSTLCDAEPCTVVLTRPMEIHSDRKTHPRRRAADVPPLFLLRLPCRWLPWTGGASLSASFSEPLRSRSQKARLGALLSPEAKMKTNRRCLQLSRLILPHFRASSLLQKSPQRTGSALPHRSNGIRHPADSYDGIRGTGHSFTRAQGQGLLEVGGAGGDSLEASLYEGDDAKDV
jgi:hypothetical protein